tara:strand:+ start:20905 stop:22509 length:1605 start_codon:yes stop_codon:yes gene_type:complete
MANIERAQPIAQTFNVTSLGGAYLTKVGLFFYTKAAADDHPIQVHIRPAFGGTPDGSRILENSIVYKNSSDITTSTDASVETIFQFEEPVYVEGGKTYAIIITSNAAGGSYQVYTSVLGSFVLGSTTERVQTDPYSGVFFKSSNGALFEPDTLRDLTFNLYRANFDTSLTAVVRLQASPPAPKMLQTDPFKFTASDATVRVFHPNHGFQINDTVTFSADSAGITTSTTINGVFGSSILGNRTITALDATGYTLEMDSTADSSVFGGGDGILATEQYIMDIFRPNIDIQQPINTTVSFDASYTTSKSYAGSETAYATPATTNSITNNDDNYLDDPHVITTSIRDTALSRSSFFINVNMTSSDDYVTPIIDIQRANVTTIHNIIDKQDDTATVGYNIPLDWIPDSDAYFGSAIAKHLTKTITLAEPATGIKVLVDVNRPSTSDFDVYYKTLETGADTPIEDQNWVLASKIEPSSNHAIMPISNGYSDFREYRYTIGGDYIGALTPFSVYQIKIVMHSTSSSNVPRFKRLRTIALGT